MLWPPDVKSQLLGKSLMLAKGEGEIEDERLDSITDSVVINLSRLWKIVKDRGTWRAVVHRVPRVGHNLANNNNKNGI